MQLYNDYNSYLRNKYGTKVYRVAIDAGFKCPNRDGAKGTGGCIYCSGEGSRAAYVDPKKSVEKQIEGRIAHLKEKYCAEKFIAYFQAFTNTYGNIDGLKEAYDQVLPFKDIVGMSIGTRPDTIDSGKLKLISSYNARYEVWMEYGLQSIHEKTLDFLNRGHSANDTIKAVEMTKASGLKVAVHVILGLPGETKSDMMATAGKVAALGIDGIKIHLLHVLKGSLLEEQYVKGLIGLLGQDEYAQLVCDFLELLPPNVVIQRLTGEGGRENHVAPAWALDKTGTIKRIKETLEQRGSFQGSKFPTPNSRLRTPD